MFLAVMTLMAVAFIGWYGIVVDEDFELIKWIIGIKDNLLKWIKKEISNWARK